MSGFIPSGGEESFPTQILIRDRNGFKAFEGPPSYIPTDVDPMSVSVSPSSMFDQLKKGRLPPIYSPDGSIVCIIPDAGSVINLYSTLSGEKVMEIPCREAQTVEFSPLGTYIVTWSRVSASASEDGASANNLGNLQIWLASSGALVCSFSQKTYKRDLMQFTADEKLCFRSVTNEVHILRGSDLAAGIVTKLIHKGVTQFRASPVSTPATGIAVFNPEAGGKPARITLYTYAHTDEGSTPAEIQGPVSSRTVFSANEASMYWNSTGTALLVHTHSDVDKSNSSYYGSTNLFIMTVDGTLSEQVSQSKEGPIHDVKWAPGGDRFVVAAGNMPSHCTLYNNKGEPTYEFGAAHRNTISWSPHGRFLVLAGFGNLAGEMDFFDTQRMKKAGSNTAHCSVSWGWSPDSRYFMTATLAPRMNVDNGFKIFRYNGQGPVVNVPLEQAFDAVWRPAAAGVYPNRGPSPKRNRPGEEGAAAAPAPAPAAKPAAYRPPGSSGALAEMLRREKAPAGKVKTAAASSASASVPAAGGGGAASNQRRIPGMPPGGQQRTIPGMPPAAANANKQGGGGGSQKNRSGGGGGGSDSSGKQAAPKKAAATPAPAPAPAAAAASSAAAEDNQPLTAEIVATMTTEAKEKRAKNVKKKLKQIEEIKTRKQSGAALNADQLNKLTTEEVLVKELALLAV